MALYSVATGANIQALDVTQFYNLFTGVMTDQAVTLGNILSVSPGTYRGALGVGTSSPNYFGWTNASVETIYGGTSGGTAELVGTAVDGAGAVAGMIAFEATMNATHEVRLATVQGQSAGTTAGNRGGNLIFSSKADGGSLLEAMRIDQNQRLGIGTTAPAGPLHVVGPTGAVRVFSGAVGTDTALQVGRVSADGSLAAVGIAGDFHPSTAQGDAVLRVESATAKLFLGAANGAFTGIAVAGAHVLGYGAAPTLGALQSGVSSQSISGTDLRFVVTITTAGASPPGVGAAVALVTFNTAYGVAPVVIPASESYNVGAVGFGTTPPTTSGFTIGTQTALAINTTYTIGVVVVG